MYYVYVLRLNDSRVYVGSTPDLRRRVDEHQHGKAEATKNFRPVKLIWYSAYTSRLLARRFEAYLKTGSGKAFLRKRFIEN